MIEKLIDFSLRNKLVIFLFTLTIVAYGVYALLNISIGAVPDITNNQVQVITTTRNLSTEDVEKFLTAPVEMEMANLPGVTEIRSISKFGLSVVTVVFEDDMGSYLPRQLISEKLKTAEENIPSGFGSPTMGPISTGLGEIYQYILDVQPGFEDQYSVTELRTMQDWIVKRQLSGIPGVVEVNTWGGFLKTYQVSIDPKKMNSLNVTVTDVFEAMENSNSIAGGGYIEKSNEAYFIRAEGLLKSIEDIEGIVVAHRSGFPIYVKDIGDVGFGHATRFGAITGNGEGEKVLGQVMMLKGAFSNKVINDVKARVDQIQKILPEGVFINPVLERSELIGRTTDTIAENLILGCLIVIFVVILLLGNIRSGLVVASLIPLCLLFAVSLMYIFGVDANLMSLGAIDFGIIIDGAVIIVEYVSFKITQQSAELGIAEGREKNRLVDQITFAGTSKMMRSAIFGQLIIIIVFIPVLTLSGVEGKMFIPMAQTFCFALLGAIVLCFTYVPVMSSLMIKPSSSDKDNISNRVVQKLQRLYIGILSKALDYKKSVLAAAILFFLFAGFVFSKMGGEFIPTLDEGDFVIQPVLKTGMSLEATVDMTTRMEKIIKRFPEVRQVVSRIGAAEVPTDPMSMEESDVMITLKPKNTWTSTDSKDQLAEIIKDAIEEEIPAIEIEFTQPIEMRFNELITGARADLAIKVFGEDLDILNEIAQEIKQEIINVAGAEDVTVEKTAGLPQMIVNYDRNEIAKYGIRISDLNDVVSMAFAGVSSGKIFEGERQFDLVIKYDKSERQNIDDLKNALVGLPNGTQLPMSTFADISYSTGPARISRDDAKRRVVVGVNVRGRDLQSVVNEVSLIIDSKIKIPPGYLVEYGGQFENLESATKRLMIATPVALFLIFIMLYFAFNSILHTLIVFSAIPLASIGGVLLLYLRDMPFSISAGVGFIALFGIAVLNGIVLIEHFKDIKMEGVANIKQRVVQGASERLRPVLLTAIAAAFGFLPMAVSTSAGAEVQRPLATVVIGGLISVTLLTLIVLPILYTMFVGEKSKPISISKQTLLIICIASAPMFLNGQQNISVDRAIQIAHERNRNLQSGQLEVQRTMALMNVASEKEKTRFYYQYDRNNIAENDRPLHVFGASQSFKLPGLVKAKKDLILSQAELASKGIEISKTIISREVSKTYYDIVHYRLIKAEYSDQLRIYNDYKNAVERKLELGATSRLILLEALSRLRLVEIAIQEVVQKEKLSILKFNQWLYSENEFDIVINDSTRVALFHNDESEHPQVSSYQAQLDKADKEKLVAQKSKLPELDIAIFSGLNSLNDFKWYPGFEAGVALPLWGKSYKAKEIASKINIDIKSLELENQKRALQYKKEQLLLQLSQYDERIKRYELNDEILRNEIIKVSKQTFEGEEIDLADHVRSLEQAFKIKLEYLENLNNYNKTAIELNYILNY